MAGGVAFVNSFAGKPIPMRGGDRTRGHGREISCLTKVVAELVLPVEGPKLANVPVLDKWCFIPARQYQRPPSFDGATEPVIVNLPCWN